MMVGCAYPERMFKAIVVDPFWIIHVLFKFFAPFLGERSCRKICFVSRKFEKDASNAATNKKEGGKKRKLGNMGNMKQRLNPKNLTLNKVKKPLHKEKTKRLPNKTRRRLAGAAGQRDEPAQQGHKGDPRQQVGGAGCVRLAGLGDVGCCRRGGWRRGCFFERG